MKALILALGLSTVLAAGLQAGSVRLTDGSSVSGEVTELDNGDVRVKTGAGDITVPKAKVAAVVKEGSATESNGGYDNSYVEGVLARRAKHGNEDGIPRTGNLQQTQWLFTVGQLNYTGDAFSATGSNLSGISYGMAYANSFTDYIAMEAWGDYSFASKDLGAGTTLTLNRFNVGIGPKVQKAIHMGGPEQTLVLIPSIGISPVYSSAVGSAGGASFNSSSFGASANAGLDFQFGGALVSAKARYLVSTDVSGSLKNTNTSAFLPQLGVGFSF
jgi:hypothetical protein